MRTRPDMHGMAGLHGVRYSWGYWAAIVAAFALLIVDIFDDSAIWNYGVVVFIIVGGKGRGRAVMEQVAGRALRTRRPSRGSLSVTFTVAEAPGATS
jgi:hypothetical protein